MGGRSDGIGQKQEITSFPIASLRIQNLMVSLIRFINNNSVISDKLFQVEFQSSRTDDSLITLIYHKNLGPDWEQQALEFASSENVSLIGRSKNQKIVIEKTPNYRVPNKNFQTRIFTIRRRATAF